jgi:hypothetical protein
MTGKPWWGDAPHKIARVGAASITPCEGIGATVAAGAVGDATDAPAADTPSAIRKRGGVAHDMN